MRYAAQVTIWVDTPTEVDAVNTVNNALEHVTEDEWVKKFAIRRLDQA